MNFENKLKDTITCPIDRPSWPTFYTKITKFANILKRLRDDELAVRSILDRWIRTEHELIVLCTEVVCVPIISRIEEFFDQVFGLFQFNIDRDVLIKKIRMYLIRYVSKKI